MRTRITRRPRRPEKLRAAPPRLFVESLEDRTLLNAGLPPLPEGAVPMRWEGVDTYHVAGQWIGRFNGITGSPEEQVRAMQGRLGEQGPSPVMVAQHLGLDGLFLFQVAPALDNYDGLYNSLVHVPGYQYLEPNTVDVRLNLTPNDSRFGELYGLHNTGQGGGTADADIDAPEAWELSTGSRTIIVAVIDTGVDYRHPDLAANMWQNPGEVPGNSLDDDGNGFVDDVFGYDFANRDGDPLDDHRHGTHVAGTVGAVGNNSLGVVGVNWNVQIMAVKWIRGSGSGDTAAAISAVNYTTLMRTRGVDVKLSNNSWRISGNSAALRDAIQAFGDAGGLFVAAAGNSGQNSDVTPVFPAAYDLPNIISVAATDSRDLKAGFSNWGRVSVDLGAPGVSILSTLPNSNYGGNSGTSMASPHVAGVAALAWSLAPNATWQQVKDAILRGVDPVNSLRADGPTPVATGGRLNALKTLQEMGNRLAGTTFNDLDEDGSRQAGEPALAGWTIELDLDDDGTVDQAVTTDALGNYSFIQVPLGTHRIREVPRPGWMQTAPAGGSYLVEVASAFEQITGRDFGNALLNPGSISGQTFRDFNADGVKDEGEPGLPGWRIFIDADDNGALDANEQFTDTDADGSYTLTGLPAGTFTVREVLPTNWLRSAPTSGFHSVSLAEGEEVTGIDFGNFQTSSVSGVKFNDLNGDGARDTGEPGLSGWTIYADLDNDGILDSNEPRAVTVAGGGFTIGGLAPGTYIIREVLLTATPSWIQTAPADGFYSVTLGPEEAATEMDFGNFRRVSISGTKFHDLNGDGIRQTGEPGVAGWAIFDDLNDNGVLDAGEPSAVTTATGTYTLTNIGPGAHLIREVPRPNWSQTAPSDGFHTVITRSGTNVPGRDFGNRSGSVTGVKFNDLNGDGARQTNEPGLAGWTIYADLNGNGVRDASEPSVVTGTNGIYALGGLPAGTVIIREVLLTATPPWVQTAPESGSYEVTIEDETTVVPGIDFGNFRRVTISGTAFHDFNADGIRQANEPGLPGWIVYDDLNDDGVFDPGEPSAVTTATGTYTLTNVGPGLHIIRELQRPGWIQTTPGPATRGAHRITTSSGSNQTGRNFGNTLLSSGSIAGAKFHDLNANGQRDAGEPGLANWTIYVDANDNGVRDTGELFAVTNTAGNYTLVGLPAGTYTIREVPLGAAPPWERTLPEEGFYTVELSAGQAETGIDFGSFRRVSLSGTTFHDLNADGVRQTGEPGLGGWTIFADLNENGAFDAGEPSTVTAATGTYTIFNVRPGAVLLREVERPNWALTAPADGAHTLNLVSAVNRTNLNFGNASGSVTGVKFHDLNGDGARQTNEPGLAGWTIYADLNGDNVLDSDEPRVVTGANGIYALGGLPAGTAIIREVLLAATPPWVQTAPESGSYEVTIEDETTVVSGIDFGNFRLVTISGTKFNDVNGNGTRDPGEPGLAGWVIFDDLDNDGVFNPGEPFAVTTATGSYSLINIGPGAHFLRAFQLPGWVPTAPAGGVHVITPTSGTNVTARDFGSRLANPSSISGQTFHDLNADGVKDEGEPGLPGWRIFIDANNNGNLDASEQFADTNADGNYTLTGLIQGTYTVREVLQTGWFRSAPSAGFYTVALTTGQSATGFDFGNFRFGSISGTKFHDLNGDGIRDEGELALEGWTVFLDLNDNGQLDQITITLEPDDYAASTDLTAVIPQARLRQEPSGIVRSATDSRASTGTRVFSSPSHGTLFHGPGEGLRVDFTVPVSSVSIDAIGSAAAQLGLLRIFNTANQLLGTFTTGPLNAGQAQTMTLSRPAGDIAYAIASSASSSFFVLLDNLHFATSEPLAVTGAQGNYTFTSLAPGTYIVREVLQEGWEQTAPEDGFYEVVLLSGESLTGFDFGNRLLEEGFRPAGRSAGSGPGPISRSAGPGRPSFAGGAAGLAEPSGGASSVPPGTHPALAQLALAFGGDTVSLDHVFASLGEEEVLSASGYPGKEALGLEDLLDRIFQKDLGSL